MSFVIYGIYNPTDNLLKYIGKTEIKLNARLSNHIYKAKSGRNKSNLSKWILELCKSGQKPIIRLISFYPDDADWQKCEREWVSKCTQDGYDLLNQTAGGNGAHSRVTLDKDILKMLGKKSDEEIAKIAGVSRKCISYHRNKLKINPMSKENYRYNPHNKGKISPKRIKFSEDIIELIGMVPDTQIAKITGAHVKTILRFRKRNKIKAYVPWGETHPGAKLCLKDVKNIIDMYKNNKTIKLIAKQHNVQYYTIWSILNNRSWKGYKR